MTGKPPKQPQRSLVEKLRIQAKDGDRYDPLGWTGPLFREAADRIEALEGALRQIADQTEGDVAKTCRAMAREAMGL